MMDMDMDIPDLSQVYPGLNEVEQFFLLDAEGAIATLEEIYAAPGGIGDTELDTYEITVHGMKSAFLNVGEPELSEFAKKLEHAAKEKNLALMAEETPAFIEALQELMEAMKARGS